MILFSMHTQIGVYFGGRIARNLLTFPAKKRILNEEIASLLFIASGIMKGQRRGA
jgi:hypothetical protein